MYYLDPNTANLPSIPAGKKVEVPIGFQTLGACNTFNNVKLMIIATCEASSASSRVVQYSTIPLTVPVQINYNMSAQLYASNATASVSMAWQGGRRRLSDISEGIHSRRELLEVQKEIMGETEEFNKIDDEEIVSQTNVGHTEMSMSVDKEMKLSREGMTIYVENSITAAITNHDGVLRTLQDEIKQQSKYMLQQKDDLTGQIDTLKDQIGALQGRIDTLLLTLMSVVTEKKQ